MDTAREHLKAMPIPDISSQGPGADAGSVTVAESSLDEHC